MFNLLLPNNASKQIKRNGKTWKDRVKNFFNSNELKAVGAAFMAKPQINKNEFY